MLWNFFFSKQRFNLKSEKKLAFKNNFLKIFQKSIFKMLKKKNPQNSQNYTTTNRWYMNLDTLLASFHFFRKKVFFIKAATTHFA